jgi:hypothetical protein
MKTQADPSNSARLEETRSAGRKAAAPSLHSGKPSIRPSGVSPEQVQMVKKVLYALLGLLIVADFFIHREHAALMWESIPGFNALYALIATVLIIVISKFLGHVWLMKPENYYGERP